MQKKDRDGAGGVLAALTSPDGQKMLRFSAVLIGLLILLLAVGGLTAGDAKPSG